MLPWDHAYQTRQGEAFEFMMKYFFVGNLPFAKIALTPCLPTIEIGILYATDIKALLISLILVEKTDGPMFRIKEAKTS